MSTLLANDNPLLPDTIWLEGILIIRANEKANNSPVMLYLWGIIKNSIYEYRKILS